MKVKRFAYASRFCNYYLILSFLDYIRLDCIIWSGPRIRDIYFRNSLDDVVIDYYLLELFIDIFINLANNRRMFVVSELWGVVG